MENSQVSFTQCLLFLRLPLCHSSRFLFQRPVMLSACFVYFGVIRILPWHSENVLPVLVSLLFISSFIFYAIFFLSQPVFSVHKKGYIPPMSMYVWLLCTFACVCMFDLFAYLHVSVCLTCLQTCMGQKKFLSKVLEHQDQCLYFCNTLRIFGFTVKWTWGNRLEFQL